MRWHVDARPLADPQHRRVAGVVAQVVPLLVDRGRARGGQVRARVVGAHPAGGRVVGLPDHHGQFGCAEPALDGQRRSAQRRFHAGHVAAQHVGRGGDPATGVADRLRGAAQVEADHDQGAVGGRGRCGELEQRLVLLGRRRAVVHAVFGVPAAHPMAGVGQGGLHDLHCGAGAGRGEGCEGARPAGEPLRLVAGGEQHVGGVTHPDRGRECLPVRVVNHHRPGDRVVVEPQRRRVAGQRHRPRGPGRGGPHAVAGLPGGDAPRPVRQHRHLVGEAAAVVGGNTERGEPGPQRRRDDDAGQPGAEHRDHEARQRQADRGQPRAGQAEQHTA